MLKFYSVSVYNQAVHTQFNFDSQENKNEAVFSKYVAKGKQYGYPFFIILSENGKLLCVQESGILEAGKGYDVEKVKQFLLKWVPAKRNK